MPTLKIYICDWCVKRLGLTGGIFFIDRRCTVCGANRPCAALRAVDQSADSEDDD